MKEGYCKGKLHISFKDFIYFQGQLRIFGLRTL